MRLHYGPVPESPDFHPQEEGWTPLREPSATVFVWQASGVGIVVGILIALLWVSTAKSGINLQLKFGGDDSARASQISSAIAIAMVVGAIGLLIVIHELLHAAMYPGRPFGQHTMIGVWPSKGLFYAHYHGPLSRNRFLLVLLAPFLVLTIGLWVVELMFHTGWGLLPGWSVLNAGFAGGDILATAITAWQVPAHAEVRNQGWRTWWRVPPITGSP